MNNELRKIIATWKDKQLLDEYSRLDPLRKQLSEIEYDHLVRIMQEMYSRRIGHYSHIPR
jgi:hypothetical protein